MNILVLHSSSDLYGASKILLVTLRILRKHGHQPIVVLSAKGPLTQAFDEEGIEYRIIPLGIIRRKYFNPIGLINRFKTSLSAISQLKSLCSDRQIDLVYSNTSAVLVGGMVARKLKISHIFHVHEIILGPVWFARLINWHISRTSTRVIAVSQAVADYLHRYIRKPIIRVVHNGLNYDELAPAQSTLRSELAIHDDALLVGMIGRVHPWKGQIYFLDIVKHLTRIMPNLKCIMAGDVFPGNEYLYEEIKDFIVANKLQNHVIDLGFRTDVPNIMKSLDVFVLPSTEPDPFPTVILEAMACGTPVAATAQGGALEMIKQDESGIHIPIDDAEKASAQIAQLLENRSKREQLGKNGQNRVNSIYSLMAFEQNMLNLLMELR